MSTADRSISALTKIAAECHRAKWRYSEDENKSAYDDLHRIGDLALKLRDQIKSSVTSGD